MSNQKKIILFDGVCNFCNFWVNFVIKRDKEDVFRFAALQSNSGIQILNNYGFDTSKNESLVLIVGDRLYRKSSAALMICRQLNSPIKTFFLLIFIPKLIREFIYDLIAKNRYIFFGRRKTCRIPTTEENYKFLI